MITERVIELISHVAPTGLLLVPLLALVSSGVTAAPQTGQLRDTTIKVEDMEIHCRIGGHGPHLLMLHGFTLTGEQWVPFANTFMDSFTVIVADLPSHGGSSPMPGAFSFERAGRYMHLLLDELGVDKVYAMGHSGGGITIVHMAGQRPDRFNGIALVNSPNRFGPECKEVAREDTWEKLDKESQKWYLNMHPGGLDQVLYIMKQYNGLAENDEMVPLESLAKVTAPVLVVWGDRDRFFPVEMAMKMYHAMPNASLLVFPNQGHTPLWDFMGGTAHNADLFTSTAFDMFRADKEESYSHTE